MTYQKTGRPRGRPKTNRTAQQCLGTRIPQALYAEISQAAAQQQCTLTACVEATLRKGLEHSQLSTDFDRAMVILAKIEQGCATCATCATKINALVSAAWAELIECVGKEHGL